eukprot:c8615_g1_i1.p1 GENE.c8615_g1_i1~~c8615_g1_i1.p1  ORF type:complete len:297 (+),score=47.36 c8615_g1_i1:2-892(+)
MGRIENMLPLSLEKGDINDKGILPDTWYELPASEFQVRGKSYMEDRVKVPSSQALYDCVSVGHYVLPNKNPLRPEDVDLPPIPHHHENLSGHTPIPLRIFLTLTYPRYSPALRTWGDGESFNIVAVFDATEATIQQSMLPTEEQPEALRLYIDFLKNEQRDTTRMKSINRLRDENLQEVMNEFLGWKTQWLRALTQFNGKPALARSEFAMEISGDTMVLAFDNHSISYLPRLGFYYFRNLMPKFIVEIAFVIEGRSGEELPECVLCCFGVHRLSPIATESTEGLPTERLHSMDLPD